MSKKPSLSDHLNGELAVIDEMMISNGIALQYRPTLALEFISGLVIEAEIDGKRFKPSQDLKDSSSQRIYFYIHNAVTGWYRQKYGEAYTSLSRNTVCGLVICLAAPFLIDVPITISKPGKKKKTAWLHFPLSVQEDENPISWLRSAPNTLKLSTKEHNYLLNSCKNISTTLRVLYSKIIGIYKGTTIFNGLITNAISHIEGAATKLFPTHDSDYNGAAFYEIQMACESIFKALLLQKVGGFPKTHNLGVLYDRSKKFLTDFDYSNIERIPPWKEINSYRYGEGGSIDLIEYNDAYKAMLYTVDSIAKPMVKIWLKDAAIEITADPFGEDSS